MHKYIAGVFVVILLSGCSAAGFSATPTPTATSIPPTSTPSSTPDPTSVCFSDSHPTFTDYVAWTKVNPKPVQGHEVYVNIYVNDLAKDTYLAASGKTFPTCATIVKAHLSGEKSDVVTALTIMVKMPAGYDPEHNDWWWAMYDSKGKSAQMSGREQVCITCHQPAAESDYVFSQKVMEESKP